MAKKDIFITPKDSITREIINLSQIDYLYINSDNKQRVTLNLGNSKNYLDFPSIEKCEMFFNKIKELMSGIDI